MNEIDLFIDSWAIVRRTRKREESQRCGEEEDAEES